MEGLHLDAVGLKANKRGYLEVNNNFQTTVPHMYVIPTTKVMPMANFLFTVMQLEIALVILLSVTSV